MCLRGDDDPDVCSQNPVFVSAELGTGTERTSDAFLTLRGTEWGFVAAEVDVYRSALTECSFRKGPRCPINKMIISLLPSTSLQSGASPTHTVVPGKDKFSTYSGVHVHVSLSLADLQSAL